MVNAPPRRRGKTNAGHGDHPEPGIPEHQNIAISVTTFWGFDVMVRHAIFSPLTHVFDCRDFTLLFALK